MAGATARIRGQCEHVIAIEPDRLRGCQIPGHNDDRLPDVVQLLALFAQQIAEQSLLDVVKVAHSLKQVSVAGALERLDVPPQHLAHGVLRRKQAIPDEIGNLLVELGVIQNREVRLEDAGDVVRIIQLFADLLAQVADLAAGAFERLFQPLDLARRLVRHQELARDPRALALHDEGRTYRDAGADGDASPDLHFTVPRRSCSGRASRARRALAGRPRLWRR